MPRSKAKERKSVLYVQLNVLMRGDNSVVLLLIAVAVYLPCVLILCSVSVSVRLCLSVTARLALSHQCCSIGSRWLTVGAISKDQQSFSFDRSHKRIEFTWSKGLWSNFGFHLVLSSTKVMSLADNDVCHASYNFWLALPKNNEGTTFVRINITVLKNDHYAEFFILIVFIFS